MHEPGSVLEEVCEFIGLGFVMQSIGGTWVVQDVYPAHDAAMQGIVPGDVVEEISGMPIQGQPGRVVGQFVRDVGARTDPAGEVSFREQLLVGGDDGVARQCVRIRL